MIEQVFASENRNVTDEVIVPGKGRGLHVAMGLRDPFATEIEREASDIAGDSADSLSPGRDAVLDALWDDERRAAQLLIYSHLETNARAGEPKGRRLVFDGDRSFLQTRDVDERHFEGEGEWGDPQTVVFLMACSTFEQKDLLSDFGISFHSAGAGAVVGTEAPVFSALLSLFAREVTRAWWGGVSLGEAIRAFRHRLLVGGNPLGFVFTLLGNADLRIKRSAV